MKDWFTKVAIPIAEKQIGYQDKILLLGSCFADNIGEKMRAHYFQSCSNPVGTLYNPNSIAKAIGDVQLSISEEQLVKWGGMWHSMMHHGSFSHLDKAEVVRRCEESRAQLRKYWQEANVVIVTFGTAWVYEMDGDVVANCHKIPLDRFVRRRLSVKEIVDLWRPILAAMPDKQWIFTVSPIRHIKDGLHDNQLSKAILLQAVEELLSGGAKNQRIEYFAAYEIMQDELRDYRFYAEDMVHPAPVAVDYIWQRFVDTYMSSTTQSEMRELHQLWRDRHHRFLHPESDEAHAFQQRLEQRIAALQLRYPWVE